MPLRLLSSRKREPVAASGKITQTLLSLKVFVFVVKNSKSSMKHRAPLTMPDDNIRMKNDKLDIMNHTYHFLYIFDNLNLLLSWLEQIFSVPDMMVNRLFACMANLGLRTRPLPFGPWLRSLWGFGQHKIGIEVSCWFVLCACFQLQYMQPSLVWSFLDLQQVDNQCP